MARSANPDRPGGAVAGAEPFSGTPPGVLVTAPGTASTPLIGLHSDHFDPVSRGHALRVQIAREGIPRQPRLSAREREIETAFAEWIEGDPSRAVEAAARLAEANGSPDQPIFEVDSIKRLVPEYGSDGKPSSDDEYHFRLEHNHALHPAAVALARMAFIDRLDVLATLPAGDPAKVPGSLEQAAQEAADAIARHLASDTAADDARREAERDARIKAAIEKLAAEGKTPPPKRAGPTED